MTRVILCRVAERTPLAPDLCCAGASLSAVSAGELIAAELAKRGGAT